MELILFLTTALLSFQSHPTQARPLSVANCNFPAPVVKPINGAAIYSCTGSELERQREKAYDEEATRWLEGPTMEPVEQGSDFPSAARPASPTTSKAVMEKGQPGESFSQPVDQDEHGHVAGDEFSGVSGFFVSIWSSASRNHGKSEAASPASDSSNVDRKSSLFDLPSAAQISGKWEELRQHGREAWGAASSHSHHDTETTQGTISLTTAYVLVFMLIGIIMSVGIAVRSGELLFRFGRRAVCRSAATLAQDVEQPAPRRRGRTMEKTLPVVTEHELEDHVLYEKAD